MFRNMKHVFVLSSAVLAVATLIGCGSGRPEVVPVSGTVTLDGDPVVGAAVTFALQGEGRPATAVTDALGKFTLTTFGGDSGAAPGKYAVTVVKMKNGSQSGDPENEGLMGAEVIEPSQDLYEVPQRYSDPQTSDLKVEVKAGMEPVTLALTSE